MEPQNSNPIYHYLLAGHESPICHRVNFPVGVVIQAKGNQWSMSDIFLMFNTDGERLKLLVLSGKRANRSMSTLGKVGPLYIT